MKIKVLLFIVVSLFYLSCDSNEVDYVKPDFDLQTPSTFDETEVEIFKDFFGDKEMIVSQETLVNFEISYEADNDIYTEYGVTNLFEYYNLINKETYYFDNSIYTDNYNIKIVPFEEINYFFNIDFNGNLDTFWQLAENNEVKFKTFYPNAEGIYSFSRIAFNIENTKCYFMYQLLNAFGGNHGSIFGEKVNDKWIFTEHLEVIYN